MTSNGSPWNPEPEGGKIFERTKRHKTKETLMDRPTIKGEREKKGKPQKSIEGRNKGNVRRVTPSLFWA